MPKITVVLIAFVAALVWVFILKDNANEPVADSSPVATEQVAQ